MTERLIHWRQTQNPEYLGAWALQPGEEKILTVTAAGVEKVVGTDGKKEDCLVVRYKEKFGPGKMICNATNSRTISALANSPYLQQWPGTQFQVYADKVRAFGETVEALRIRPHKVKPINGPKCSACSTLIQAAYGRSPEALAEYTKEKFNAVLCAACAGKRAGEGNSE